MRRQMGSLFHWSLHSGWGNDLKLGNTSVKKVSLDKKLSAVIHMKLDRNVVSGSWGRLCLGRGSRERPHRGLGDGWEPSPSPIPPSCLQTCPSPAGSIFVSQGHWQTSLRWTEENKATAFFEGFAQTQVLLSRRKFLQYLNQHILQLIWRLSHYDPEYTSETGHLLSVEWVVLFPFV